MVARLVSAPALSSEDRAAIIELAQQALLRFQAAPLSTAATAAATAAVQDDLQPASPRMRP
jgi:hypothetical protein